MKLVFFVTPQMTFGVCRRDYWVENQHLSDRFDRDIHAFMKKAGFEQIRTNAFQRPPHTTVKEARDILLGMGLEEVEAHFGKRNEGQNG